MSLPRKYMVEAQVCGICAHYRQHYVRNREGYFLPLWYGPCALPWPRHPPPEQGSARWTKNGEEPASQG